MTSYDEFMTNVTGLTGSVGLTGCGRTNRTRSALWDLHHRQSQPHRMRWPHIIKQTSQDEASLTGLGGPKRMRSASQDKAGLRGKRPASWNGGGFGQLDSRRLATHVNVVLNL